MKRLTAIAAVLLLTGCFWGQEVTPATMFFEATPPNTSPIEEVAFLNQGTANLSLSATISGPPFAIAQNRCLNVRPDSHCNVYVTYTPQSVGVQDSGTLTLDYGAAQVSIALTGAGVAVIPTWSLMRPGPGQCDKVQVDTSFAMYAQVGVHDRYYTSPTGESVAISCTNGAENVDLGQFKLVFMNATTGQAGKAPKASIVPDQVGNWSCTLDYAGDGVLGPTQATVTFVVGTTYKNRKCN